MRFSSATLLLVALGSRLAAQEPDWTVRLTVPPAKSPSPALRYVLLPELRDTTPGNAAMLYYRAFSPEWITHRRPEIQKPLDAWRTDTRQKPSDELRWVLNYRALDEIARGARRSYCDWELTERARKDGFSMLLPDIQSFRDFASLLALRARFEMAAGEHDKVARTLQTGFTLARHVSEGPTLIQALVGLAIQGIMMEELQRWIETPGAPNLYWALTNLPTPYVDLRKPLQGEKFFLDAMFPGLRENMAARKPPGIAPRKMLEVVALTSDSAMPKQDGMGEFGQLIALAVYAAKLHPEAKKALLEEGWKPADVQALPVTQAALILEVLNYDRIYDEHAKWIGLPYRQAREGLEKADRRFRATSAEETVGTVLARLLLPALQKVSQSAVRADRRIAAMRSVEALRLHAAAKGEWPARLDDVTEVPIPDDPLTGKPFEYRIEGDRAFLTGPPPRGERPASYNSVKYEITLKK